MKALTITQPWATLIADYEKTTGIYSHSGALRQAVRPMIEMLERNLTDRAAA